MFNLTPTFYYFSKISLPHTTLQFAEVFLGRLPSLLTACFM